MGELFRTYKTINIKSYFILKIIIKNLFDISKFLYAFALFVVLSSVSIITYADCNRSTCNYIGDPSAATTSWQTVSGNVPNGTTYNRYDFYLTNGNTYEFSLCSADGGAASYDSYMCLYGMGYGCGYTTFLTSNDDNCSLQSKITYLATSSGWTSLYISGYNSNYGSYTLAYRYTSPCGPPSSVTAYANGSSSNSICNGSSVSLTEGTYSGGNCSGGSWEYRWRIGGTTVRDWSTTETYTPSPTTTTTYTLDMRCSACSGSYTSDDVTVTVNTLSTVPTSITGTNSLCFGESTTLTVNGGSLGTGASWRWYSVSCGGTLVGTGSSIIVTPSANTTYYVRAEGTCNTTGCVSRTVTISGTPGAVSTTGLPAGTSIATTPATPGAALGLDGGLTYSYTNASWPACVHWGIPTTMAAVNLYSAFTPENPGACTFNNLTFDAANTETNLAQGKACFTGTYNYYCMNSSWAYHYNDCRVRLRVIVTKADGVTPIPFIQIGSTLLIHAKENFKVKAYIEGYAWIDLSGCQ